MIRGSAAQLFLQYLYGKKGGKHHGRSVMAAAEGLRVVMRTGEGDLAVIRPAAPRHRYRVAHTSRRITRGKISNMAGTSARSGE
jgi:hypothetical protein